MIGSGVRRFRKIAFRITIYVLAVFILIYVLAPYCWLVISSISTKADLLTIPMRWFPERPTFENFTNIFFSKGTSTTDTATQFKTAFMNSLQVAVIVTVICLVIGLMATYAFSRLRFRGRKPAFYGILAMQMLPPVALIIPLYMIVLQFRLIDKKLALVIVYLSFILPFVIWILKGYIDSIPVEMEEAARIDGCGRLRAFVYVMLPMASSGLAATTIFAFILSWNEFFYALLLTTTLASKTLPFVITEFSSKFGVDYIMTSTGGVLASLPPVLLALVFQKYIISGLTAGAVKG